MRCQVKSKERVQQHGEVFTNEREVKAMLDMVKQQSKSITATFLEPACGDGNFLVEILRRKLDSVKRLYKQDKRKFELNSLRAVASIYGVDIQQDNVEEARARLFDDYFAVYVKSFRCKPSQPLQNAVQYILERNIQCGNTLTYTSAEGEPLTITEWLFDEDGNAERKVYSYREMVETGCEAKPIQEYPCVYYAWLDNN
jgi:hypothetical protein